MMQRGSRSILMSAVLLFFLSSFVFGAEQRPFESAGVLPASAQEVHPLQVNAHVPELILMGLDGRPFDLNAAIALKPSILVFYRGGWCQYCAAQLAQLQEKAQTLKELGYQIIVISPDRPDKIKKSLEMKQYSYQFLSDSYNIGSKAFGIAYRLNDEENKQYKTLGIDVETASGRKDHVLPVPAIFIVDSSGQIKFVYANPDFRVRLDNEQLIAAATTAVKPEANATAGK
jgi:peroxiredoxin